MRYLVYYIFEWQWFIWVLTHNIVVISSTICWENVVRSLSHRNFFKNSISKYAISQYKTCYRPILRNSLLKCRGSHVSGNLPMWKGPNSYSWLFWSTLSSLGATFLYDTSCLYCVNVISFQRCTEVVITDFLQCLALLVGWRVKYVHQLYQRWCWRIREVIEPLIEPASGPRVTRKLADIQVTVVVLISRNVWPGGVMVKALDSQPLAASCGCAYISQAVRLETRELLRHCGTRRSNWKSEWGCMGRSQGLVGRDEWSVGREQVFDGKNWIFHLMWRVLVNSLWYFCHWPCQKILHSCRHQVLPFLWCNLLTCNHWGI